MSKLVGLCQSINVVFQPKDAQGPHQHAETNGEVATLKALERRS